MLAERLAEYIMPDVVWTGGISELRKIANLAEVYYVPVSPHDASGPINILAGAHTMMTVPNFYRVEIATGVLDMYAEMVSPPLDIRSGVLHLSDSPGPWHRAEHRLPGSQPGPGLVVRASRWLRWAGRT